MVGRVSVVATLVSLLDPVIRLTVPALDEHDDSDVASNSMVPVWNLGAH